MNRFNPEAGATPEPYDPTDIAVVEESARVMWRAFPYFAWRYGERGRAFGRSDAGFLVTLTQLAEPAALAQVRWLVRLLAPRGMPSILLDYQLESLGRAARRAHRPGANQLRSLAATLRRERSTVVDGATLAACAQPCQVAARGVARRRGAGLLIAAAVADRAAGLGDHDDALVRWFIDAEPDDAPWAEACVAVLAQARARCGVVIAAHDASAK